MPRWRKREEDAEGTATRAATSAAATTHGLLRNDGFLQRGVEPTEPVVERDVRLPAQNLLRARDVGLPDLRIVDRQRLEDDLAAAAPDLEHLLGQLEQRELLRVAD